MTDDICNLIGNNLKKNADILLVILFGSYACQRENNSSDIDLAIVKQGNFTVDYKIELANQLSQICCKEVDIVNLEEAHGALLQEILTRGKILMYTDLAIYDKLIKRMLGEKEDDSRVHARIVEERQKIWLRQTQR